MRVPGPVSQAVLPRFVLGLSIVALLMVWGGSQATAQLPGSTPTPEVANLPPGVELRFAADLPFTGGDYQWHLLRGTTSLPGDEPITVHQGVLVASTGSVLVSHQDARVDIVEQGRGLLLAEGEVVLPVSLDNAPQDLLIAELVQLAAPAEALPTETPDYVAPGTIAAGAYIVALVYVPASPDASTQADAVMAAALTPGLTIAEGDPSGGTPETATGARWIVALFAPSADLPASSQGTGQGQGTGTGNGGTPPVTATMTPTPTVTPSPTVTPTEMPVATAPPAGSGSGSDSTTLNPANSSRSAADDDGDGLTNDAEAVYGSNPSDYDTDDDHLSDGWEVDYGTSPTRSDSDGDGLSDSAEFNSTGTDPLYWDTDGDILDDGDELLIFGTDPFNSDTDGDGVDDYDEVQAGTDPLNP